MTAIRAVVSAASGRMPSFSSSTMPWRAPSSAIAWCAAASSGRRAPASQRSMPTAYIERRMRRTISERRSLGSSPSANAARSGSVKDSASHIITSICAPDSWSSPASA